MSKAKIKGLGVNIYVADLEREVSYFNRLGFSTCTLGNKEAILKDDYGFVIWLKDADTYIEAPGRMTLGLIPDKDKGESSSNALYDFLMYTEYSYANVFPLEQHGELFHSLAQLKNREGVTVELCSLPIAEEDI